MSKWMKLSGSTAAIALMTGSAAFADVNAQEVWSDWKAYMEGFGYEMTATEATSGDTLTVSDMAMRMTLPENAGQVSVAIGEMSFTNQGDGTVAVGIPAAQELKIGVMPEGEGPVDITLDYTNDGFQMIVSGSMNDMVYTYSADAIGLKLKELVAEGETVPIGAAEMTISDIDGNSTMKIGNLRQISQVMKAGALSYDLDFANPDNAEEVVKFNGKLGMLDVNGNVSVPTGDFDMNNMAAMLNAGFAMDAVYSYTGGSTNFRIVDGSDTVQGSGSSDSGAFEVAMSRDALKYLVSAKGQKLNFAGGEIPFPVDIALGETLFKLVMPVSKTEDTRDFALGVTLRDFVTSDAIWGLVDPQGALPHDPATVAFDLSGKAKLAFDLMDPEQQKALERGELGIPAEVESLNVNNIEVNAAGAELLGKGGFVFDFPTVMMSQGMQGIDGVLDLTLTGAVGLSQKLVQMGLVPQDQAMGLPMMLGMFAVPTGEDAYKSKIEVKKDGQVLANGQRLK